MVDDDIDVTMAKPRTSTRDHVDLRQRLTEWLTAQLPAGAAPTVSELSAPTTNGLSSETLLFDVDWHDGTTARTQRCAARLAPDPTAVPVFPAYDLERQIQLIRLVDERTNVPVPHVLWYEPDGAALSSPFFVMERVDGDVPPDLMPYTFGSWLSEASADDRTRLQRASIGVLSELHAMHAPPHDVAFLEIDQPGDTALRRHVTDQEAYYAWVAHDGVRSPLIERTFEWLEDHWPADDTEAVVSWGDARIGNILYRDFEPVAVLDWEMAALGPRELDIAWMITLHQFFQEIAEALELPGMPDFMRRDDVATMYETQSGVTPHDLSFYEVYASLRHAIIMFRIGRRAVHFGETEMPDDPDDLVTHRGMVQRMLDGTYWSTP
jgi:aminoglycoside phosphotransferase (APT) family kinase protein